MNKKLTYLFESILLSLSASCVFNIILILSAIPETEPDLYIRFFEIFILTIVFIYMTILIIKKLFRLIEVKGGKKDQENVRNKETY